jgi:hypothetical protein
MLIVATVVIGMYFILMQWNLNFLFPQIQSHATNNYSLNAKLLGDIKLEISPLPKITITNMELWDSSNEYKISVPKAQIKIGFLNLLSKQNFLDFNNITLFNPKIDISSDTGFNFKELNELYVDQFKNNTSSNVSIINGKIQFINEDTSGIVKQLENFNLSYTNSSGKNISVKTDFSEAKNSYSFFVEADGIDKNLSPTNLSISLTHNLLHLYTNLKKDQDSGSLLGKIDLHFDDKPSDALIDVKKFINQEHFQSVQADVELNSQFLKVTNFTTTSENIKNIKGNFSYYLANSKIDADIAIDELNLDAVLLKFYGKDSKNELDSANVLNFLTTKTDLDFSKFITSSVNLNIAKLLYKQGDINNFILNFDIWSSTTPRRTKVLLNNLSMTLPGDSKFNTYGILYNVIVPTFKGQMSFTSAKPKEFLLWQYKSDFSENDKVYNSPILAQSGVTLMPYVFQLNGVQVASQNTQVLADVLTLNYPNNKNSQCYTDVVADNVNLDDFGLNDKFDDLIYILYSTDFNNSEKDFIQQTNNLNFLRSQNGSKSFYIEVNNLTFKNELFHNITVDVDLSRNYLRLDHLRVEHDLLKYTGEVKLHSSNIKPKLDINLNFSKFDNKLIDTILPSQTSLKKRYQEAISNKEQDKQQSAISDINFYGINNFNGKFNIHIDKFYSEDTEFDDVLVNGNLVDGGVNIKNISAKGFNGDIKATGSISTSRPIFAAQCGIGLSNIDPSLLMSYLTDTDNNSGYLSASGTLSTKGMSKNDFTNNMNGSFQLQAKDIKYNGFDLVELANLPQLNATYDEKMKQLNYYSKYGQTNFSDVSGALTITNGVANLSNITLTNDRANGSLNLVYSLLDNSLSANSKFSFFPKANATPVVINLSSSGDITNAQTVIDTTELEQCLRK